VNEVQELLLRLMELASFNDFDGELVASDLRKHSDLWRGAVLDRDGLIKLRDLPYRRWNVDTLSILPAPGREDELFALADTWGADEVDWVGGEEGCCQLGSWSSESRDNPRQYLRVWWD